MRELIRDAKTIVIKVGTTSLTHENGTLDLRKLEMLAQVLTDLENAGKRIVLVSSGAIGCGMVRLGFTKRPTTLRGKQTAASVGQGLLMGIYHKFFDEYHQNIGQILLTKDVFNHEIKADNAKNTLLALMNRKIIPIVNENDCIATDEIQEESFGDNDILSAMTAEMVNAELLIILSDVDGFYDSNPILNKNAKRIKIVKYIDENVCKLAGESHSKFGTGGMSTKISAARYATDLGIHTVIASGDNIKNLYHILDSEDIGTFFVGKIKGESIKC